MKNKILLLIVLLGVYSCSTITEKVTEIAEKENKYLLEVQLHNELDLRDLYDDLISKGYTVKEKK